MGQSTSTLDDAGIHKLHTADGGISISAEPPFAARLVTVVTVDGQRTSARAWARFRCPFLIRKGATRKERLAHRGTVAHHGSPQAGGRRPQGRGAGVTFSFNFIPVNPSTRTLYDRWAPLLHAGHGEKQDSGAYWRASSVVHTFGRSRTSTDGTCPVTCPPARTQCAAAAPPDIVR